MYKDQKVAPVNYRENDIFGYKNAPKMRREYLILQGMSNDKRLLAKTKKGFPYKRLAEDSLYFSAYYELHECVQKHKSEEGTLTQNEMEDAWGDKFKALKLAGIKGELQYTAVNAPFFTKMIGLASGAAYY